MHRYLNLQTSAFIYRDVKTAQNATTTLQPINVLTAGAIRHQCFRKQGFCGTLQKKQHPSHTLITYLVSPHTKKQ